MINHNQIILPQSCRPCFPGQFAPPGVQTCRNCPRGTYANAAGASSCTPCAAGSFNGALGSSSCTACPVNTYQRGVGTLSCQGCPSGTATTTKGSVSCAACLPGSVSSSGSFGCRSCVAGKFMSASGGSKCNNCLPGTESLSIGMTACNPCAAGKFSKTGGGACTSCPAGRYSKPGAMSCTPCAPGSYAPADGLDKCTPCAPTMYAAKAGSLTCAACPDSTPGSTSEFTGAMGCGSACNPGSAPARGGKCAMCAAGKFAPAGAPRCQSCPRGQYSGTLGSPSCTQCAAGTYQAIAGSSSCMRCATGKFEPAQGATFCLNCPVGTKSGKGAKMCTNCLAGTYGAKSFKGKKCSMCPIGTYHAMTAASSCLACIPGSVSLSLGASACTVCPAGKFSKKGTEACIRCPAGSYSSRGSTSVSSCFLLHFSFSLFFSIIGRSPASTCLILIFFPFGVKSVSSALPAASRPPRARPSAPLAPPANSPEGLALCVVRPARLRAPGPSARLLDRWAAGFSAPLASTPTRAVAPALVAHPAFLQPRELQNALPAGPARVPSSVHRRVCRAQPVAWRPRPSLGSARFARLAPMPLASSSASAAPMALSHQRVPCHAPCAKLVLMLSLPPRVRSLSLPALPLLGPCSALPGPRLARAVWARKLTPRATE